MSLLAASADSADASSGATVLDISTVNTSTTIKARIAGIYLSSDTATKLTLSCGAAENQKHDQHVAANGGAVVWARPGAWLYIGDAATDVTVTSAAAAAVACTIWYDLSERA